MDNMLRQHVSNSWEKFLNPQSLRSNLISCSLFIIAWETFRKSTIDYLKGFYNLSQDSELGSYTEKYQSQVLDRNRSPLMASLLWFLEAEAIDQEDLDAIDRIRKHRNDIAHKLPHFIASIDYEVDIELFTELIELTSKIGRWWVLEVEVPTNSDFDNREITVSEVQSGDMSFLGLLLQIAAGDEEDSVAFYNQFKKYL